MLRFIDHERGIVMPASSVIDSAVSVLPSVVSVSGSVTDSAVLSVARDLLQGYTGEYAFFQYGGNALYTSYYLVLADTVEYDSETAVITAYDDCTVYCIASLYQLEIPEPETFTGTLIGTEEQVIRGSYQQNAVQKTEYVTRSFSVESVSVDCAVPETAASYVVYGSAEGLPHLIDGEQNYLFLVAALIVGCIGFSLIDRLFRRVY